MDLLVALFWGTLAGAAVAALALIARQLRRIADALDRRRLIDVAVDAAREAGEYSACAACGEYGCEGDWHAGDCPNNPANL